LGLLSDLGQQLNRVRHLRELMRTAVQVLLRHSGAACIILRPLYGGALLGRSVMRVQAAFTPLRPFFHDLEEEHASRLLKDTSGMEPVFHRIGGRESAGAPPFPPMLMVAPLIFQDQVVGTLTAFGGRDENDLLFVADKEAKRFLAAIGSQIAHGLERVLSRERLESISVENDRKLRETTLLYRISRAMHSTLRLNELIHLILSAAVAPGVGGFERAMLFMINERSDTLQGMLCVTRETASILLPPDVGAAAWERPVVTEQAQEAQRQAPCCRKVVKQRLPLSDDNPLAQAARRGRVLFVPRPSMEGPLAAALANDLRMGPYACAPLLGRDRPFGVLVVDNPDSGEDIPPSRRRFLELFANQAGGAMEKSMLLHRLETAHQDLRETQERLIQGEKMAVLGEMAASVAHELRNPLVPIGGFAKRLARSAAEGSRDLEYASIIVRETQRMEEMLSNILAFSKKQMLCFGECQIASILQEAIDLEAEALARGAVLVVREIAPDLPPLFCDEKKLRQVLINLITNARQAMPEGGTLTLRAARILFRGEDAIALEVEDTGGGIPAEILHNIFNPFFTTKDKGTGLGLSISRRIVEQHRGEIEVRNRERGAAFALRLPLAGDAAPGSLTR
jgi:signal transduction histidine kinase